MDIFRTKKPTTEAHADPSALRRCLTATDLTLMGIGVIIGAGVFVLTGIAAATKAGPAIMLSYVVAGLASMFAALTYAELATSIGGCGSAYNYTYAGFGELIAWIIGWNLLFEYTLAVSTVAIGWSGYVNDALIAFHLHLPHALLKSPQEGGVINLPSVLIIALLGSLLYAGIKQSTRFNAIIVFIKLITIAIFIGIAVRHVNPVNWQNFFPFGWLGVTQGAALVFYAYIGFDALSTAAEETINPQHTLPIGITLSVMICAVIYVIVAGLLTSVVPYTTLNVQAPVADALLHLGYRIGAGIVAVGAIAGLTTVMLIMYYGLSRVLLAISRDGLLPSVFAKINPRTKTPTTTIVLSGIIIAALAGFLPLNEAAELVNIGTLAAFTIVCAGAILLRYTQPNLPRPFKLPFHPLIPVLGIIFCVALMLNLPAITWWRFVIWIILGFVIYFVYSYKHSLLNQSR
ncbi:MAG: hypothetical protein ACD_45C00210G0005 [uncultured bacterium]|nr:MAG: hypothetical protein ACD_45C00210G0005 [uncultured bacterium]